MGRHFRGPRFSISGLGLIAALAGAGLLSAGAAQESWNAKAEKLVAAAKASPTIEKNLKDLVDGVGGRMSGSPAMRKATAWAVEAFRQAGVDDVRTEKFMLPAGWTPAPRPDLSVVEPNIMLGRPLYLAAWGWTPGTPEGGLTAALVDVGDGAAADFAQAGEKAKGAILLVHTKVIQTWEDLFGEYFNGEEVKARAIQAGAAGVLWISTREGMLLYRHPQRLDGKIGELPIALIAREDGEMLAKLVRERERVRVKLEMGNQAAGPVEEENVVAEIRGSEKPEEFVILGAHLDSWELGKGALDNGCNAVLVVEAARAIKAAGLRPKRTIRFVLFSGEEQGMHGSRAYVEQHRAEMGRTRAVVIYDEGIGRVKGYSLGGRAEIEEGVREVLKPVESWGANEHTVDAFVGTDNFDFLLEGVPNLVANQEEGNYIRNYHASTDTLDKVDVETLRKHVGLAGVTILGIAGRAAPLAPRQTRAQIGALAKETGLDGQMKAFGLWEEWEKGTRGRK